VDSGSQRADTHLRESRFGDNKVDGMRGGARLVLFPLGS
jgi:hypothetical protein